MRGKVWESQHPARAHFRALGTQAARSVLHLPLGVWTRVRRLFFGSPRDVKDTAVLHKMSLIAFLAWVGLGADGLSSSAYGPEEAYRQLGEHTYLAVFLALATAGTVFIISYAYSRIIEHFPHGGGGYIVSTQLLGKPFGVVSGCALLVDYILTITVSIASGGDAAFSLLPTEYLHYKLPVECAAVALLIIMNLRGVKESVTLLLPIFLTFLLTHIILIGGGIVRHLSYLPTVTENVRQGFHSGAAELGKWGLFLLFLRAYSLGGGTYTGIEAVSNGIAIMREPRVETGKRTMRYMAVSLAFTAGGLILCYLLTDIHPSHGRTLNATLAYQMFGGLSLASWPVGQWFAGLTIAAEAILLMVAAQTGFIDGPRVMAYMSLDNWIPRRFSALSERLTIQNGVLLMGVAAALALWYTRGHIGILVVMYSINVFATFSLSQTGMLRFWWRRRRTDPQYRHNLPVHALGLVLCLSILCVMLSMKFQEGGWITVTTTLVCIAVCFFIHQHYEGVARQIRKLERTLQGLPIESEHPTPDFDPQKPTAVILVGGFTHLARHCLLTVFQLFPETFHNVVFVSVGVIDSEVFKGDNPLPELEEHTRQRLEVQADFARKLGIPARCTYRIGTEVVQVASELCLELHHQYPRAVIFGGELVFDSPRWYDRVLHNQTAHAIQQRLRFAGVPVVILPVRLLREQGWTKFLRKVLPWP